MDNNCSPNHGACAEAPLPAEPGKETIELSGNQRLLITRALPTMAPDLSATAVPAQGDCLHLINAEGTITLSIRLTAAGPVVEVGGGSMALKVEGDLAIAARRLRFHATEEVMISSDADARIVARENLVTQGRRQEVTATHGDVRVYANDDVKIDGERIRMNS